MVETHGLTHLSLSVRDPDRPLRFYADVFGVVEYFRDERSVQVKGPGPHDLIAFEKRPDAGEPGDIGHFGFRLTDPAHIDRAVEEVLRAGDRLLRRGEFGPGLPYAYVTDPDLYQIEIWFEK